MATKRSPKAGVPKNVEKKNEDSLDKDEELNTSPKIVRHQSSKCASPEMQNTAQHSGATEKRGVEKITASECTENSRDVTRDYSPPTKQTSSSKSVRFKDDQKEDERRPETLHKQLSHSDGKVSEEVMIEECILGRRSVNKVIHQLAASYSKIVHLLVSTYNQCR
jgi:hypothetical protein